MPAHLEWRRRLLTCTDDQLPGLLKHARDTLDQHRGYGRAHKPRSKDETREQRDQRIVTDGEGWEPRDVAVHFRCAVADATRARRDTGRDENTGKPIAPRNQRALQLHAKG